MRRVKQQIAAILCHSVPVLNPKFMSAPLFITETSSGQCRKQWIVTNKLVGLNFSVYLGALDSFSGKPKFFYRNNESRRIIHNKKTKTKEQNYLSGKLKEQKYSVRISFWKQKLGHPKEFQSVSFILKLCCSQVYHFALTSPRWSQLLMRSWQKWDKK